jgi:hypothetical protein
MKKYLLILLLPFISCKQSPCVNFKSDAKKFGEEFKHVHMKYIQDNKELLSDEKMLAGMDSIARLYFVDKNIILINRYPQCVEAVTSLNYIKDKIPKKELKTLFKTIPKEFESDTNYVSIKKFLKN